MASEIEQRWSKVTMVVGMCLNVLSHCTVGLTCRQFACEEDQQDPELMAPEGEVHGRDIDGQDAVAPLADGRDIPADRVVLNRKSLSMAWSLQLKAVGHC